MAKSLFLSKKVLVWGNNAHVWDQVRYSEGDWIIMHLSPCLGLRLAPRGSPSASLAEPFKPNDTFGRAMQQIEARLIENYNF